MVLSSNAIIPVVMFHSVGLEGSEWSKSYLSEPVERFSEKLERLKKRGTTFIHWGELYHYMSQKTTLPLPAVMLTFDDGYLDNWVYTFPIIKKLGVKVTIFVTPEFVDPSREARPNLEDVWGGRLNQDQLQSRGFLNWEEMRQMEKSGLVDIQSHALTHTWYFCHPEIVDFYHEGADYPWLGWNLFPSKKFSYMFDNQHELIPRGYPIFRFDKSLICRRYFPDPDFIQRLLDFAGKEGDSFFHKKNWRDILMEQAMRLRNEYCQDSLETENEYHSRVLSELTESKAIIEQELDKSVNFICWPGGAYNETVLSLAKEAGYKSWTLSSRDKGSFRNLPGADPKQIKRVSSFSRYTIGGKKQLHYAGGHYFLCGLERHKGSTLYKWLGRLILGIAVAKSALPRRRET